MSYNRLGTIRHPYDTRQQLFVSPAVDTHVPRHQLDRVIREVDAKTAKLATWNLLSIGGPVIGTANTAVELGIANGT
jgi:hypothetical protein